VIVAVSPHIQSRLTSRNLHYPQASTDFVKIWTRGRRVVILCISV
jgi:hypothetical protein